MRWDYFFAGAAMGATAMLLVQTKQTRPIRPRISEGERAMADETRLLFKLAGVVKLQRALMFKGLSLSESGAIDEPTQFALRTFQKQEGIAATGLPDYETLRRLAVEPSEVFRRLTQLPG